MYIQNEMYVDTEILKLVLSKMLTKTIMRVDYQLQQLQGGTLGDVRLVTGMAEASDGEELPYKVVWKTQKKWERYGDPNSWRREYDLYTSDFGKSFTDSLRWPECYYSEMNDNEIHLWIEYIDGVSSLNLTSEMFECAAEELGRFQGKVYAKQPEVLKNFNNLSKVELTKKVYLRYQSWKVVYDYIRSDDCGIPKHLCQMLIDIDNNIDTIFSNMEKLPIVLCHRDFWVANIFYRDSKIVLIDWDTTGWGYMGEDIASLIADEADVGNMVEYYQKCVPAYYKGFMEYVNVPHISDHYVYELILIMFGYRLVEWYQSAKSAEDKMLQINTLQTIYEMKSL